MSNYIHDSIINQSYTDNPNFNDIIYIISDKIAYCKKCKKTITKNKSMRHYKESHLNIHEQCPFCGIKIKRLTPHLNNNCHKFKSFKKAEIESHKVLFFTNSVNNNIKKKPETTGGDINSKKKSVFFKPQIEKKDNISINMSDSLSISKELIKEYSNLFAKNYGDLYVFKSCQLGMGSHGCLNFGIEPKHNNYIAIKTYKDTNKIQFTKEVNILKRLEKYDIFPKVIKYDDSEELGFFLAQTLMGPNLKKILAFQNGFFDKKTILNIAIDLLLCLEKIHKEGIFHGDIKPSNIVWNCFSEDNNKPKIILIDFSCSIDNLSDVGNQKLIGNFSYGSLNQNTNNSIHPKDEIESLIYNLLFFCNVNLPWDDYYHKYKKYRCQECVNLKKNFLIEDNVLNDMKILPIIFNDIKRKTNKSTIDYNYYRKLILNEINEDKNIEKESKGRFIWEKKIKYIFFSPKKEKDFKETENNLFNILFEGFPKEVIKKVLMNYIIKNNI